MSVTYIWIRHGHKAYSNGKCGDDDHKHDPPLVETERQKCAFLGSKLIEDYGHPTSVVVSPYLRTRQTAMYMMEENKIDTDKLLIDSDIGEYLGNQKPLHEHDNPDVHETTRCYKLPPLGESFYELKKRVKIHVNKYVHSPIKKTNVVWIITHGIFICQIMKDLSNYEAVTKLNSDIKENVVKSGRKFPNYLEGFVMVKDFISNNEIKIFPVFASESLE